MSRAALILAFVLSAVATPAAVELTLEDGQVLQGTDVVRKGERYLLELEGGKVLAIPAALVSKVALTGESRYTEEGLRRSVREEVADEDRDPDAPTALRDAGPETLAGGDREKDVRGPKTAEQVRVLGVAASFPVSMIDPVWIPESDWSSDTEEQNNFNPSRWSGSAVDPRWRPSSAYRADDDVMEPNDSSWRASIVDPDWDPEDGFEPRNRMFPLTSGGDSVAEEPPSGEFRRATFAGSRPETSTETPPPSLTRNAYPLPKSPQFGDYSPDRVAREASEKIPMTAERCLRRIFEEYGADADTQLPPSRAIDEAALNVLPASLHEVDRPMRVVFAVSADDCRAVAGDIDELLGTEFVSEDHALAWSANAFNTALRAGGSVAFETVEEKIDYARAVARLLEPGATGDDDPQLLLRRDELDRVVAGNAGGCKIGKRARRRELRAAQRAFHEAGATIGVAGDMVTFFTWRRTGGVVASYSVFLTSDGLVTFRRSVVAAHVGDHDCLRADGTLRAGSSAARGR